MKKKIVVINFNSAIPDLSGWFEILPPDRLPEMDALVVWTDCVGEGQAAAGFARSLGIPVYVVQHGWYNAGYTEYQERGEKVTPGTHYFAWSEASRQLFIEAGASPGNVTVIGCPLYPLRVPRETAQGVVLFAPAHADDRVEAKELVTTCNAIWAKLSAIEGIKPFMKLCKGEHLTGNEPHKIFTDRNDPNHVRQIFKILAQVSLVVTQDEGTFSLLSYVMNLPVIKVANVYPRRTNGCDEVKLDELETAIRFALAHPDAAAYRRKEVVEEVGGPLDESQKAASRIAHEILKTLPIEVGVI